MYRTDYQNQCDTARHQQRMWQYAHQYRLAETAREPKKFAWLGLLLQMLTGLFRS